MKDTIAETLIAMACVIGIAAGGVYLYRNVNVGCVDLWFYKACGAGVSR